MPAENALELLDDAHSTIMRLAHGAERLALANGDGTARQVADAYKRAASILADELRPVVERDAAMAVKAVRALPLPEAPPPTPVAWGAMPTVAEAAAHVARAEPYSHAGAPWLRRYVAFDGSDVTGVEVVYLSHERGRVWLRRPTTGVTYLPTAREVASEWRPIDGDGCAMPRDVR
jgi:hypothetical protein